VWSSADGFQWERATITPSFLERQGHSLVVFHNKLWMVGRLNDVENGGGNDIWYSDDGITWQRTIIDPPWIGREDHSTLVFNDLLYVFGGMGADWQWKNDVWVSN
jgi:hypothetical protein